MNNFIIYGYFYDDGGQFVSLWKEGEAVSAATAERMARLLTEEEKAAEEIDKERAPRALHGRLHRAYGYKAKQGRWMDQSQALEQAAKMAGVYAIR